MLMYASGISAPVMLTASNWPLLLLTAGTTSATVRSTRTSPTCLIQMLQLLIRFEHLTLPEEVTKTVAMGMGILLTTR